jgi:hypothetical protein
LKNSINIFHANEQGKGSNFSQTWQVFAGLSMSTTWLQNCKKKKKTPAQKFVL